MYPDWVGFVLIGMIALWLLILTYLVNQERQFLKKLFPQKDGGIKEKLDEVLKEVDSLGEFKRQSVTHLQGVALKRYNPYDDTGGDLSFSLSILDGKGDGIVVTALHARSGTRIFAKPVKKGKETKLKFSEEEKEVVAESLR